ncbi:MAG TPA: hypothetical protein VNN76_09705 [Bacteroidota bacterium]|nr:hypothetical protein [Bacteroidota bacterium]
MHRWLLRIPMAVCILATPVAVVPAQTQQDTLKEIQRQIEILTQELERMKLGEVSEERYEAQRGLGPAAAKVYQLKKTGVSIAGYGEVVYENYDRQRDDGADANKKDQVDYLRNVVYVGFRFNDWILFNSEIEFEHASTGKGGEVSMEFGYVELMLSKGLNIRAGMVLPPVGIVNEKHEPSTFFGSLRPLVERSIIPSTWRTNGLGAYGEFGLFNYRAYVVEGLDAAKFTDIDGIRGGRQSGARSLAEDLGITGKVEFTGLPGSVLGFSFYNGNSGQGRKDSAGATIKANTTVLSVHGEFAWKGLEVRALYAANSIDEAEKVSKLAGRTIGSSMTGYYVVAGYDIIPWIVPGSAHALVPFVQYEAVNTHASVPAGSTASKAADRTVLTLGFSYKPHPNVAFKFDHSDISNKAITAINQWNLALNYLF